MLTYVVICSHGIPQHIVALIPGAVVMCGGDVGKAGSLVQHIHGQCDAVGPRQCLAVKRGMRSLNIVDCRSLSTRRSSVWS